MPDPRKESLDEIVSHSATVLADQIQKAATWAKSEMDLQVEVAGALKEFARRAQITLEGHHNVTIATGRPDSVYGSVIVEYKDPNTLSSTKDAAPNQRLIEQLKKRFYDMRREEKRQWSSMFGVGTDGKYFVFLRFRDEKWTDQEPLEVNRYSTERFLWALYNLGQKGKPYQPEYLHGDFGSDSRIAQEGVATLYEEILNTDNPRAQVFFSQWKILFGEVCGYDVENLTDKLKKLAEFYGVKGRPHPAQLLFALHTYFAVLIKLLAAEIVSFFNPWMPRQVEKLQNATTSAKLKRELEQLERGGIFHDMGITNFLEGDLFSWYLAVWSEPIEQLARKMIGKLDEYNPGTFSEDPALSRDLLKKLYQQLFPKSVRHDLGEYYTPDWLAEHVLNELGYEGDPDKRLLDPACGSGTFLVMAINRIRRWYDANREKYSYDEGELLKKILANVVGFDLNPLAVMAARTNYLVAIKDLIRHVDQVEIPVYLCDSIMTPGEYSDLFTGGAGNVAKVPCSAMKPPHLLVPKEIAKSPKEVATYAETLETCIKNGYSSKEFLARCRDEGLKITVTEAHTDLYTELVRLDKENKNGIWARIIKNNFAPLFVGTMDYVAGNPPWVNWESLPEDYRDGMKPLWQRYGLFTLSGSAGRLGGGKKDLSMLFVYSAVDHYLLHAGRLGFVITQTVFKTKGAGDGFRQFSFDHDKKRVFIKPLVVHDLSELQVFEGATNRASVFVCERQEKHFKYPVTYVKWSGPSRIEQDEALATVLKKTARKELEAVPVEVEKQSSPWLTAPAVALLGIQKVIGKSDYKAWEGVNTGGLNGCFWIQIIERLKDGTLLIENLSDVGKIKVEQVRTVIEPDLVYPLVRGRDISRWHAEPSAHIILAQDPEAGKGIAESEMKKSCPKTFAYFKTFEGSREKLERGTLRGRALYKQYFRQTDPFYSMYNVGAYSLSQWKVMWPEVGNTVRAGVCGPRKVDSEKPALPDHTIIAVACESGEEAHYICALLDSSPAQCAASGYIVLHPSPHIMEHIAIPRFNPKDTTHRRLRELSEASHLAAAKDDIKGLASLEKEVDQIAAKLWGITNDELESIQEAQADARSSGGGVQGEDGE
jgi:Eco57I restriction-modification methylase